MFRILAHGLILGAVWIGLILGARSSFGQGWDVAGYSIFGAGIGEGGIVELNGDLVVPGGANYGGFFQVLRYDQINRNLRPVFISENFGDLGLVAKLAVAQLDSDPEFELVVALSGGSIVTYDSLPWREIRRFQYDLSLSTITIADLNGDGLDDIVTASVTRVRGLRGDGAHLWTFLSGVNNYLSLAAGELDGDSAIDVMLGDGRILDTQTLQIEGTVPGITNSIRSIEVANLDNDVQLEVIFTHMDRVIGYDLASNRQLWSLPYASARLARLSDTDGDRRPELVVTSGNLPSIHIYDLNSLGLLRSFTFSDCGGVADFIFRDLDQDLRQNLYLGVGHSCSGPDSFYVADAFSGVISWQNEQLDGPLAPISSGDLDSDGIKEIVTATGTASQGLESGRVIILDSSTLASKFVSPPLVGNRSMGTVDQVKLVDIIGNATPEILIGSDDQYSGVVEGYSWGPGNSWNLIWRNASSPQGVSFTSFEVADIDGDNALDLVVGERKLGSTATGPHIRAYDIATRAEKWSSEAFFGGLLDFPALTSITIDNLDNDSTPEIAAIWSSAGLMPQVVVIDGQSGRTEWRQSGPYASVKIVGGNLVVGTMTGNLIVFRRAPSGRYSQVFQQNFGQGSIMGVSLSFGGLLSLGIEGRLALYDLNTLTQVFSSAPFGQNGGVSAILTILSSGQPALLTAGNNAVHALTGN